MAYEMTIWKARNGSGLNRFLKSGETSTVVYLENAPDSITESGTAFSPQVMNHIEAGIAAAHDEIAVEVAARQDALAAEAQNRQQADSGLMQMIENKSQALSAAINNEEVARQQDINAMRQAFADIISLIEAKLGQLNYTFQLVTEDGDYLVTESGDYLVTA